MTKRFLIISLVFLACLGVCKYYGLFTPYNIITAKRDIGNGKVRFISVGLPVISPQQAEIEALCEQYAVKDTNIGCTILQDEEKGIEVYNKEMERHLEKRNGKGWMKRFQKEMDSILNRK